MTDGSIPDGFELRSPPLAYADLNLLLDVFVRLRSAGARRSSDRAGVHVHIDARALTVQQAVNLVTLWAGDEPLLRCLLDVHPRRAIRYCRPVAPVAEVMAYEAIPDLDALKEVWYRESHDHEETKHRAINLHSYFWRKTIEFRAFASTNRKDKLGAFVLVALAYAATARDAQGRVPFRQGLRPESAPAALESMLELLQRMGLATPEFADVADTMAANIDRTFARQRRESRRSIFFRTRKTEFDGGSYRELLEEMLDNGFFSSPEVRAALRQRSFSKGRDIPAAVRWSGSPEEFSRRIVGRLATERVGELRDDNLGMT